MGNPKVTKATERPRDILHSLKASWGWRQRYKKKREESKRISELVEERGQIFELGICTNPKRNFLHANRESWLKMLSRIERSYNTQIETTIQQKLAHKLRQRYRKGLARFSRTKTTRFSRSVWHFVHYWFLCRHINQELSVQFRTTDWWHSFEAEVWHENREISVKDKSEIFCWKCIFDFSVQR